MGKLVVALDGVVVKEVQITKDKTTLGRRPYNDIVIDNLAVSGEHAVLVMSGRDTFIEDLNSTNGTYINGKAIKKQQLNHNDTIEVGKYRIKFLVEDTAEYERTMIVKGPVPAPVSTTASAPTSYAGLGGASTFGAAASANANAPTSVFSGPSTFGPGPGLNTPSGFGGLPPSAAVGPASIKVISGAAAGREVALTKVVTTVGKPGVQVASITKRPVGYVFSHVEGPQRPTINGQVVSGEGVPLKNGDVIELSGTKMQFVQA